MPELLLELFSEEIPARMQAQAGRDLERMAREHLAKAGLTPESLTAYAGPRRLTLVAQGLPASTPDREEELKGPRANAPEQALEGFLRKTGLTKAQLTERDGVFFAALKTPGRATPEIVAEMVPAIMAAFPWPKSMRSGTSHFRWVRPLKRILCLFDGKVVPFEAGGVSSGDLTEGHRFMGSDRTPFSVTSFDQYRAELFAHFVQLDASNRKKLIVDGARAACAAEGLELVEDEGLLDEVSGLSEWPTPILGPMDPAFLDLPAEVIRTSMRTHQKYFAVRDPRTGKLAPRFIVVANVEPKDGGAVIAAGNAKVLSARLSDARFFWEQDTRPGAFEAWSKKLEGVTFHAKLGTLAERVERIEALAREIAPLVGADPELAAKAARLCKADLASGMVGEFPELQGVMGGYYARAQGLEGEVCDAIRDHYKPVGPSDSVPTAPVTVAVALADKLDTLVGFFAIDEKPTGSKDPYALRRAALGVIRLLLENQVSLDVYKVGGLLLRELVLQKNDDEAVHSLVAEGSTLDVWKKEWASGIATAVANSEPTWLYTTPGPAGELRLLPLTDFFYDRLKVALREAGRSHDIFDAALAATFFDFDMLRITRRVEALSDFLATEDGASLLAGYKRAANILKAEEKKNPAEADLYKLTEQLGALTTAEEEALAAALRTEVGAVDAALAVEDFTRAMQHLAHLRAPVDAFFDKVLVNDPDAAVRMTRLRLLTQVRDTANRVADFSLISG
jgi:glycyl-tRNA synthetase beta chain